MFGFGKSTKVPKGMEHFMDALLKVVGGEQRIVDSLQERLSDALDDMYHDKVITEDQHHDLQLFLAEGCGFDDSFLKDPVKPAEPEKTEEEIKKEAAAKKQAEQKKAQQAIAEKEPEPSVKPDTSKQHQPDSHAPAKQMGTTSMTPNKDVKKTLADCPPGMSNNAAKKWCKHNGVNWDKDAYHKQNNPGIMSKVKNAIIGKKEEPAPEPQQRDPKAPMPLPDAENPKPQQVQQQPKKEAAKPQQQKPKEQPKATTKKTVTSSFDDWADDEDDRKAA